MGAMKIWDSGYRGKATLAIEGDCSCISRIGGDNQAKNTSLSGKLFDVVQEHRPMTSLTIRSNDSQINQLAVTSIVGMVVNDHACQTNRRLVIKKPIELRAAAPPSSDFASQPADQLRIRQVK